MDEFKKPISFTDVPIESANRLFQVVPTIYKSDITTDEQQIEHLKDIVKKIGEFSESLTVLERETLKRYLDDSVSRSYTRDNFFYVLGLLQGVRSHVKI